MSTPRDYKSREVPSEEASANEIDEPVTTNTTIKDACLFPIPIRPLTSSRVSIPFPFQRQRNEYHPTNRQRHRRTRRRLTQNDRQTSAY